MKYQIWQICETVGSARQGWLHFLKQVDAFFVDAFFWMHLNPTGRSCSLGMRRTLQIPFSQIHPCPLPSTATSASAPSARSCSVEMHWTEAAALSWTATPCKWSACLSLVHSAWCSSQCTVHCSGSSRVKWMVELRCRDNPSTPPRNLFQRCLPSTPTCPGVLRRSKNKTLSRCLKF